MATSPCYPATSALWAGEPRGDLMDMRDWEVGRSEGHPVIYMDKSSLTAADSFQIVDFLVYRTVRPRAR